MTTKYERARWERDEAMRRVEASADPAWLLEARYYSLDVALHRLRFITDHVWDAGLRKPAKGEADERALGPVIKQLMYEGYIELTDQTSPSWRRHMAPQHV